MINCAKYITNIIFKFTVAGATPKAELSSPEKSLPMLDTQRNAQIANYQYFSRFQSCKNTNSKNG